MVSMKVRVFLNIFIAVLVVLLATEILVRTLIISPSAALPDPELGWKYRPHSEIFHTVEGFSRHRLNSLGFNDEEPGTKQKQHLVLALGDSFTEAFQVDRQDNFTSIAEMLLPCVDIFNAGRSGLTLTQYPIIAARLKSKIHFERVVLFLTAGDIQDIEHQNLRKTYDPKNGRLIDINIIVKKSSWLKQALWPIFEHSAFATYMKNRFKALDLKADNFFPWPTISVVEKNSQVKSENDEIEIVDFILKEMQENYKINILFIPTFDYLPSHKTVEREVSLKARHIFKNQADKLEIEFHSVNILGEIFKNGGNPPVGFANKDILKGHLNKKGHMLVGKALAKELSIDCSNTAVN